jgi:hypothetical protein
MAVITIEVQGLDRLQSRLAQMGQSVDPMLANMTRAVGEVLRDELKTYPVRTPSHPLNWKSQKQRRFYFAMRREKGLEYGYVRRVDDMSQNLGASWVVQQEGKTNAKVGTRVTYARYIQSADAQQPFHKDTGWITDVEAIDKVERSGAIQRIASAQVQATIRRVFGG